MRNKISNYLIPLAAAVPILAVIVTLVVVADHCHVNHASVGWVSLGFFAFAGARSMGRAIADRLYQWADRRAP